MAPEPRTATVEDLGGEEGILRWVTRFYEKVALHPLLAPMFRDLDSARAKQHAYFVEFFGGAGLYTEKYGKPFLRFKHRHFKIGQPERDAWMDLVMESLREEIGEEGVLTDVEARLRDMADKMINHHPGRKDAYFFNQ